MVGWGEVGHEHGRGQVGGGGRDSALRWCYEAFRAWTYSPIVWSHLYLPVLPLHLILLIDVQRTVVHPHNFLTDKIMSCSGSTLRIWLHKLSGAQRHRPSLSQALHCLPREPLDGIGKLEVQDPAPKAKEPIPVTIFHTLAGTMHRISTYVAAKEVHGAPMLWHVMNNRDCVNHRFALWHMVFVALGWLSAVLRNLCIVLPGLTV